MKETFEYLLRNETPTEKHKKTIIPTDPHMLVKPTVAHFLILRTKFFPREGEVIPRS